MLFDISQAVTENLTDKGFPAKERQVSVLRLDKIHPVVSGNKLFKLHYFLLEAQQSQHKTILTFGGAYSNHLAATAHACSLAGLTCIGMVRGEEPASFSHTLRQCRDEGMQLRFLSREEYDRKEDPVFLEALRREYGDCTIVPEGGYHPLGAKGAAGIHQCIHDEYTHICTAMGTATTAAGLLLGASPLQKILVVPVLKGMHDFNERIRYLTGNATPSAGLEWIDGYHFGGYAKKNDELLRFMNQAWKQYQLPLDFVYSAKLFYAVTDLVQQNYFPAGSRILCVHTGGLQGNESLPPNTLTY